MYLGIDIGGTKTIIASMDINGTIIESYRFLTPKTYENFLKELEISVDKLSTKKFSAAAVGVPGKLDRVRSKAIAFGNLPWKNVLIQEDIQNIVNCYVYIENDANLAGLSEAMLLPNYGKILYVTISTGIGTGFIVNRKIDPDMADSEGGNILLAHDGKFEPWEDFASGKAIVKRFGQRASEISSKRTWRVIAHDIALGLIDLIAIMQPDAIIVGGGLGAHYDKFKNFLNEYLKGYENPLFNIPIIREAARPELAVIYGCYYLIRANHATTS